MHKLPSRWPFQCRFALNALVVVGAFGFITACASSQNNRLAGQQAKQQDGQQDESLRRMTGSVGETKVPDMTDPYIWLENSADPKVTQWAQDHNVKSVQVLQGDARYSGFADQIRAIVTSQDRIPKPEVVGQMVRNFWQDQNHQRGIWRQTSLADYQSSNPTWDLILDIDELNRKESKSWVYQGASCLAPENDLCLISLSDGGRDEVIVREFRVSTKSFVSGGFEVPPAKTEISYIDHDTVFIGADFGPGSLTSSGYPRQVRVWKRGTPLASSKLVFSGKESDVSAVGVKVMRADSQSMYIEQSVNFFETKLFTFDGRRTQLVPLPSTGDFKGEFAGQLLMTLRQDWKAAGRTFHAGNVISMPRSVVGAKDALKHVELVYAPDSKSALEGVDLAKDFILLNLLHEVRGQLRQVKRMGGKWVVKTVQFPDQGAIAVVDVHDQTNDVFVNYQTFNVPTSLYYSSGQNLENDLKVVKTLPAQYDASDIVVEQFESTSRDGTKIPYFYVHKKGISLDGTNPTLLYAYGGFEDSSTPFYSGVTGKLWLSQGGVYILANIRGGGEFGPKWHEAAIKENRQRAYDDFTSVAQDVIAKKITSPRRLGIEGGSNGGLLVGVAMTEHPELYHAVICESALLDMIRYTLLPPGASWIGEYGDPADPKVAAYISKYSPYQNVREGVDYPEPFFHISTADDRVQPGHTRKMVARMEEKGHPVLFFENTEGGHGGAADPEQVVRKTAFEFVYLYQKLKD